MKDVDDLLSGLYSASIAEISVLVRQVSVRVGVLPAPVTIRIYYDCRHTEPYRFELSATMQTASRSDEECCDGRAMTESDALRQGIRLLTHDYDEAVREGKLPDDSWLVPVPR
jgi:hypothetical protein